MTVDPFNPPEFTLSAGAHSRRRAHLRIELERDLLAPPRSQLGRGFRTRRVAAVAAAIAVAIVVLSVALPGRLETTRLSLVDQALAAFGSGPTIHVVLDRPNAAQLVDLKTGRIRAVDSRMEFWTNGKLGSSFSITLGGSVVQRQTLPRNSWAAAAAQWRPFVVGYRRQLQHGAFHIVSKGRIAGTPVAWIAARPTPLQDGRRFLQEIAISTRTYKPLYVRDLLDGHPVPGTGTRVVVAETTTRRVPAFAHPAPLSGGYGEVANGSVGIPTTIAAARRALHREPLVPSKRIAGLHRTWIGQPEYLLPPANSYKDEVDGLSLYYGTLDSYGYPTYSGSYISINEIDRHAATVLIGPGYFRSAEAVINTQGVAQQATATLKAGNLYVIINASNRAQAIAAVRALTR